MAALCAPAWDPANKWFLRPSAFGLIAFSTRLSQHLDNLVESNVHFPTDYNLLWDSSRKSLDMVGKFQKKYPWIPGWRKKHDWYRQMKNSMRAVGKACSSGGRNKEQRINQAVRYYLTKAKTLQDKLKNSEFPILDEMDTLIFICLSRFV